MELKKRFIGEIRTVDEIGMLIRVQEYEIDDDGGDTVTEYVTDDGKQCEAFPDGRFKIVEDGRILSRLD